MKSIRLLGVLSLCLLLFVGCGIKKEVHEKTLKDLADTQAALQVKEDALKECQNGLKLCQDDVSKTKDALSSMNENYNSLNKDKASLDQEYTNTKEQLLKIKRANDLRQKAMDELLAKFDTLIKSGKLSVGINDGRMVVQLSSNVLFKVGSATLSKDGAAAVSEVAEVLKTISDRKFQVAGHTDNQRESKTQNPNWTLSYNRARSVFDVLVKNGMNEGLLSIAAYAEYSPVADNATDEGRNANRRIEIVLLPTSDELPLKQLKKFESVNQSIGETK